MRIPIRGLRGVRAGLGPCPPFSLVSLSSSDLPVESHQLSVSIYFILRASGCTGRCTRTPQFHIIYLRYIGTPIQKILKLGRAGIVLPRPDVINVKNRIDYWREMA